MNFTVNIYTALFPWDGSQHLCMTDILKYLIILAQPIVMEIH